MNRDAVEASVEAFIRMRPHLGEDEISILEAALFVEQDLGLPLGDGEITREHLGSPSALRTFILKKWETGKPCAGSVES